LLTIGDRQRKPEVPVALYVKVVGYVDLATATAAWYVAAADVVNDAFGGTVFPLERVGKRTVNLYWVAGERKGET
jgi:succinate-acetate transporter protein